MDRLADLLPASHTSLYGIMGFQRIHTLVRGMHAVGARYGVPAVDGLDYGGRFKRIHQRSTIHVSTHRQVQKGEDGGADVQQGGTEKNFVFFNTRSLYDHDAVWAVLCGRPCRLSGNMSGSQVIRLKPMIRCQHHRCILSGLLKQPAQEYVMVNVTGRHHVFVDLIVLPRDPRLARRSWLVMTEGT